MEQVTLRQCRDSDLEPYAAMNADPEVMRYFPAVLNRDQSKASLNRQRSFIENRGWGLWAVDVDRIFAGFTGLAVPTFEAPFMPCVEAGWRLRREFWGQGIGYRAGLQALDFGFKVLKLPQFPKDTNSGPTSFTARTRHLKVRPSSNFRSSST